MTPITRRSFIAVLSAVTGNTILSGCIPVARRSENEEPGAIARTAVQPQDVFSRVDQGLPIVPAGQYLRRQKQQQLQLAEAMARYKADFALGKERSYEALVRRVIDPYVQMVRLALNTDQAFATPAVSKRPTINGGSVLIPPGGILAYTQKGYCMDPNLPAPVKNDALVLQPASERVSRDLMPLYRAMGRWAATGKNTGMAQSLTWALMGAGSDSYNWISNMPREVRQQLDEIMPGGADRLIQVHNTRKLEKEIVRGLMKATKLDQTIDPNMVLRSMSEANTRSILSQLIRDGERMTEGKGIGYSNLSPDVVARAFGTGPLEGRFEIINAGNTDFEFSPIDYMATPIAKKQSISGTLSMKDIAIGVVRPPAKEESKAVTDLAIDMGKDLTKYLLEKGWDGAWEALGRKTPAASAAARKAMSQKMGQGTAKMIGSLIGVTPVLGNALSLYEFVSGKDFMTGETLGAAERLLAGIGTIPGANTLRTLGRGIQYAEGATGVARLSNNAAFRLIDQTAVGRDLAGFLVSDTAKGLGGALAALNDESKATMQQLVINADLPWQGPTARAINDLKTGMAKW